MACSLFKGVEFEVSSVFSGFFSTLLLCFSFSSGFSAFFSSFSFFFFFLFKASPSETGFEASFIVSLFSGWTKLVKND